MHGVSVQDSPDGLSLIGLVTPETCSLEALQSVVNRKLPSHMRPSAMLPVGSLPKTYSGKIDHHKIKEDVASYIRCARKRAESAFGPTNMLPGSKLRAEQEVENFISQAWQEEIGLSETPSTSVNFFDIGGHR